MSALLSLVMLFAVPDDTSGSAASAALKGTSPCVQSGRELEQAVDAALHRWAKPSQNEAELAARQFLTLYEQLHHDTALAQTVRQRLSAKLRRRLAALSTQITKQATAAKRQVAERPKGVGGDKQGDVLAQRAGGWGQPRGGPGLGGSLAPPTAAARDAGEDLVELIQTVISPKSWDRMGGPGTIRYWRPGRALVVRASADVNDRVADLLDQMHRAGQ
jgi:hypothetical protein